MRFESGDILFHNVSIIDGRGTRARYLASVIIRGSRIHSISNSIILDEAQRSGIQVIDGENGKWILCPGFINMHAHSDLSILHTPEHIAKISQGVTTEVIGQDGISYAPTTDATMPRIAQQLIGWNGRPTHPPGFFDKGRSVKEFLDVIDQEMPATNIAYLVPQGNLRVLAKGYASSPCTSAEIQHQRDILKQCLEEGAVGMSSGLTYVPGLFADDAELAELCKVVRDYGAYYCPHHRSYGRGSVQAYREMIMLAKETGVRLHLTHASLNFDENAGRADELLEMIEDGLAEGLNISLDSYPYIAGSTMLSSTLPSWATSVDDKLTFLNDAEALKRLKRECTVDGTDGYHGLPLDWHLIEVAGVTNESLLSSHVGKTLLEIAKERNMDPFDAYVDLLKADDFETTAIFHFGNEKNVRRIMGHHSHTGSSDGILTATKPHPRGWGTFSRYLGHYVRDLPQGVSRNIYNHDRLDVMEETEPEMVFSGGLEEVIAHLTSRAARIIGVVDRGVVGEGFYADLVLFDPTEICDRATYARPQERSKGIRTVLINGQLALDEGRPTGNRSGRTLRLRKSENVNSSASYSVA